MTKRVKFSLLAIVLSTVLLFIFAGCNDEPEFRTDLLFSVEDFATDANYANSLITMVLRWQYEMREFKGYMGAQQGAIDFTEALPTGWSAASGDHEGWYEYDDPNGAKRFIRFDHNVGTDHAVDPVKIEFQSIYDVDFVIGTSESISDYLSIGYANDYNNFQVMEGTGVYEEVTALFYANAATFQYAGMFNAWEAEITNLSADVFGNVQGDYAFTGNTYIVNPENADSVAQDIMGSVHLRPNGSGNGNVFVDGEERVRVEFTYFDNSLHGYVYQSSDDFEENERLPF